jgi:hypothetical protein
MAEGKNPANPDCILTAAGYGKIVVPVIAIDFGPSIVATEDMGRDNRVFYPMQAQLDTFIISAVFASKAKSNDFNRWLWRYAEFASSTGSALAVGLRVQVPARRFDFMGFPTQGWSYHFAPVQLSDVTWVVQVNFDGASPVGGQSWASEAQASRYFSPLLPGDPDQLMFYPGYYDPGATQYTGNPSDSLYRKKPTPKSA